MAYTYEYEGKKVPTPILLGDWVFQEVVYVPNKNGYEYLYKDFFFQNNKDYPLAYLSITEAKIASHILYGYSPFSTGE